MGLLLTRGAGLEFHLGVLNRRWHRAETGQQEKQVAIVTQSLQQKTDGTGLLVQTNR